jgi:UDP-N-acetyl-D-galactosamine dehydrogenase
MGAYIGQQTIKQLIHAGHDVSKCTITVLGLTFKENCPDLRNSKVIDVIRELQSYGVNVQVCDPEADAHEAIEEYNIPLIPLNELPPAEAIVIAVAHKEFAAFNTANYQALLKHNPVVIDVKGLCDPTQFAAAGIRLWRL